MLYSRPAISADAALDLVRRALAHAKAEEISVAVAVVDCHGVIVASARMDGVPPPVADFALDKAYTAGTLGKDTVAFGERMDSIPTLRLGLATRPRMLTWGGGLPIFKDGQCVGGIGISGARDEEDIACGKAVIAAAGFDPLD